MAYVLALLGSDVRRDITEGDAVVVGRDDECDLVIDEHHASRRHFKVWCADGIARIEDLGSSNGTLVDGAKLVAVGALLPGQRVSIGATELALIEPGDPVPPKTPSPWRLVGVGDEADGNQIDLAYGETTVGRNKDAIWQLDLTGISGNHARLEVARDANQITVTDVGSSNGTFVDGKRLEPNQATETGVGHKLRFGAATFRVERSDAEPERTGARSPVAELVPFRLIGAGAPVIGQTFALAVGSREIGRGDGCMLRIDDASVSTKHATLEVEGTPPALWVTDHSSNGTYIDGERIAREHRTRLSSGQQLRLGAVNLKVEGAKESRKLPGRSSARLEPARPAGAGGLISTAIIALVLIVGGGLAVQLIPRDQPAAVDPGRGGGQAAVMGSQQSSVGSIASARPRFDATAFRALLLACKYKQARELLQGVDGVDDRQRRTLDRHQALLDSLQQGLRLRKGSGSLPPTLFGFAGAKLTSIDSEQVTLERPGGAAIRLRWDELTPDELGAAYRELGLHLRRPLEFASFCYVHQDLRGAIESLRHGVAKELCRIDEVAVLLSELRWEVDTETLLTKLPLPEPKDKPITRRDPEEERRKAEAAEAERLRLEREAELKVRLEQNRIEGGEIAALARVLRYEEALRSMRELIEVVRGEGHPLADELARDLEAELRILELEDGLFGRLIEQINTAGIALDRVPGLVSSDAAAGGKLAKADRLKYTILLRGGQISEYWRYLGAKRLLQLFELLSKTPENLLARGVFAYQRDQLWAANKALMAAKRKSPEGARAVDEYLAAKLGVPIPKGGFVAYKGRLVTPRELEMRAKGMVRHGDQWVTPEDKAKLEAGMVKYNGKWVPADEAKLLAKGLIKVGDKWLTRAEANKVHEKWENAWVISNERINLRSNMPIDFNEELMARLEASYKIFAKLWGKTPDKAMNFYAFRTYEDYRKFCMDNNLQQILAASGVAIPGRNICVGYSRSNNRAQFLGTMIHEHAHLFYGRAFPRAAIPSWFAEAMATYQEAHKWEDPAKREVLITGEWNVGRFRTLQATIKRGQWIPIPELMTTSAVEALNTSRARVGAFYSQAWAIWYYLERGSDDELHKKWREFVKQMTSGALRSRPRMGGGPNGLNQAAKKMFEEMVISTTELDSLLKDFFSDPAKHKKGALPRRP